MSPSERFTQLTALLRQYEPYWRPSPFVYPTPAWCSENTALAEACLQLPDGMPAELEADPNALQQWLQAQLPGLQALNDWLALPAPSVSTVTLPAHWSVDIPGRKWQQIAAFAALTPAHQGPLLDWCSGKSHLGRTLAQQRKLPLVAVERDAVLCREGYEQARAAGVSAEFLCADVLHAPPALPGNAQVLALHACGDLHRSLLRQLAVHPVRQLVLAPCCYHLWLRSDYLPLSAAAQQNDLRLDRNSVQLAVQEAVTSSPRVRKQTATLAAWRLGFDALQRQLRGVDEYLNTPSLPQLVLAEGFEAVCRRIAKHKQLALPDGIDWQHYQTLGEQRYARAQKLQVVRHGFRRAIELWLVLDLALYLEQLGYAVELQQFCDRQLTPRNILLRAERG
ncbi:MAG: methyltransferase [Pseudomonadota bacterium]